MNAIESTCPRCGRAMLLPLPADCDPVDAQRLAKFVLCESCSPPVEEPKHPEPTRASWAERSQPRDE